MMNKPNIFKFATKELSQDAFIAWLVSWASPELNSEDQPLNETAKQFVRHLLGFDEQFEIFKIKVKPQWKRIDISIEVNDKYFILVEDKTHSKESKDQLVCYSKIANDHYINKGYLVHCVYLKTGNEPANSLDKIISKGYRIVSRQCLLRLLGQSSSNHPILQDYLAHIRNLEDKTNSFMSFEMLKSSGRVAEGMFMELEKLEKHKSSWGYVPNQSGGFMGFWYGFYKTPSFGHVYVQIVLPWSANPQVVIKVGKWEPVVEILHKALKDVVQISKKHGLALRKPDRFRAGSTSTLAIAENALRADENGLLDWEHFITTLSSIEKTIEEYSSQSQ